MHSGLLVVMLFLTIKNAFSTVGNASFIHDVTKINPDQIHSYLLPPPKTAYSLINRDQHQINVPGVRVSQNTLIKNLKMSLHLVVNHQYPYLIWPPWIQN